MSAPEEIPARDAGERNEDIIAFFINSETEGRQLRQQAIQLLQKDADRQVGERPAEKEQVGRMMSQPAQRWFRVPQRSHTTTPSDPVPPMGEGSPHAPVGFDEPDVHSLSVRLGVRS